MLERLDNRYIRIREAGVLAYQSNGDALLAVFLSSAGFPHRLSIGAFQLLFRRDIQVVKF
jgi:hypothetical protein